MKYMRLDQKGSIMAEYIWIDAFGATRSKSRVRLPTPDTIESTQEHTILPLYVWLASLTSIFMAAANDGSDISEVGLNFPAAKLSSQEWRLPLGTRSWPSSVQFCLMSAIYLLPRSTINKPKRPVVSISDIQLPSDFSPN